MVLSDFNFENRIPKLHIFKVYIMRDRRLQFYFPSIYPLDTIKWTVNFDKTCYYKETNIMPHKVLSKPVPTLLLLFNSRFLFLRVQILFDILLNTLMLAENLNFWSENYWCYCMKTKASCNVKWKSKLMFCMTIEQVKIS